MTEDQRFLGMIGVISGRMVMIGIFILALWTNHLLAAKCAIASEGASYICAMLQVAERSWLATPIFWLAFALGLVAFLSILF